MGCRDCIWMRVISGRLIDIKVHSASDYTFRNRTREKIVFSKQNKTCCQVCFVPQNFVICPLGLVEFVFVLLRIVPLTQSRTVTN